MPAPFAIPKKLYLVLPIVRTLCDIFVNLSVVVIAFAKSL